MLVVVCLQVLSVLGVLLRNKAARNAGTLLMWALQQPQLIDMDHAQLPPPDTPRTLAGLLYHSSWCLGTLAAAFANTNSVSSSSSSNSIGTYAAAMTQQLEQSGGWCTPLCTGLQQLVPATKRLDLPTQNFVDYVDYLYVPYV
jgi:hypothetical protein